MSSPECSLAANFDGSALLDFINVSDEAHHRRI